MRVKGLHIISQNCVIWSCDCTPTNLSFL